MTDLVAFIEARLAEDQALAEAARRGDGRWEYRDRSDDPDTYPWTVWAPDVRLNAGTGFAPAEAHHIARHDPARVLREVAAKREILAAVVRWKDPHPGRPCTNEDWPDEDSCDLHVAATRRLPPYVLNVLASAWSDHRDYDESWRA